MCGKQTSIIFYSNRVYLKNFTASLECMGWFLALDLEKKPTNESKQTNRVKDAQFDFSLTPKLV